MGEQTLSLTREISVVGRSRECDVRLQDPAASRRHFQVELRDGELWARDLGSSNGTYRNGRRLQGEERLRNGDVLLVGETEITVRIRDSAEKAAEIPSATTRIPELADSPPAPDETPSRGLPVSGGQDAKTTVTAPPPPPPATEDSPESGPASPPEPAKEPESVSALLPPPPLRESKTGADDEGEEPGSPEARLPDIDDVALDTGARTSEEGPEAPVRSRPGATAGPGSLRPAGFWIRLAALLVDGIAIGAVSWLVGAPFGGSAELVLSSLASFLLGVGIPVVGWARWGTTPGKRLFGLWVCQEDGEIGVEWSQSAIRWIGYLASGIPLGIGFLMVAFSATKRGLHDRMA
ncbi:MAG: RDD family protein, partial [Thermoanaerobaculia bacterium]|nr:RDD family protein [Thermoanaerobaculia bacterium]